MKESVREAMRLKEITERRSIRAYRPDPVPRACLEAVLEAARQAPSSKNRQPWRFTVTAGAGKREALAVMRRGLTREAQSPLLPESAPDLAGAWRTLAVMEEAPAVIFVTDALGQDPRRSPAADGRVSDLCSAQSIGACMENMCLQAAALGLGSLWICDSFFAWEELSAWLGGNLAAALALGYAAEDPPPRPRIPLEQLVQWRTGEEGGQS